MSDPASAHSASDDSSPSDLELASENKVVDSSDSKSPISEYHRTQQLHGERNALYEKLVSLWNQELERPVSELIGPWEAGWELFVEHSQEEVSEGIRQLEDLRRLLDQMERKWDHWKQKALNEFRELVDPFNGQHPGWKLKRLYPDHASDRQYQWIHKAWTKGLPSPLDVIEDARDTSGPRQYLTRLREELRYAPEGKHFVDEYAQNWLCLLMALLDSAQVPDLKTGEREKQICESLLSKQNRDYLPLSFLVGAMVIPSRTLCRKFWQSQKPSITPSESLVSESSEEENPTIRVISQWNNTLYCIAEELMVATRDVSGSQQFGFVYEREFRTWQKLHLQQSIGSSQVPASSDKESDNKIKPNYNEDTRILRVGEWVQNKPFKSDSRVPDVLISLQQAGWPENEPVELLLNHPSIISLPLPKKISALKQSIKDFLKKKSNLPVCPIEITVLRVPRPPVLKVQWKWRKPSESRKPTVQNEPTSG